jgi:hypothetical protein
MLQRVSAEVDERAFSCLAAWSGDENISVAVSWVIFRRLLREPVLAARGITSELITL